MQSQSAFRPMQGRMTMLLGVILAVAFILTGPGVEHGQAQATEDLNVVVTTTILGDVVANVAGDAFDPQVLLDPGQNPHTAPLDPTMLRAMVEADVVLAQGLGFEEFLEDALEASGDEITLVRVSDGIPTRQLGDVVDQHAWFNPANVAIWTDNVREVLVERDPANAEQYAINAMRYQGKLAELDAFIEERVGELDPEQRKIVADHRAWGYFADRYGFEFLGAVIPNLSDNAEPSARDVAKTIEVIRAENVPAIFVGNTARPDVAEQVAEETGAEIVQLFTGSLSGPDGPAPTYLAHMRFNVNAIVDALDRDAE